MTSRELITSARSPSNRPAISNDASATLYGRAVGVIFVAYLAVAIGLILIQGGSFFTPDRILLILAPAALMLGRGREFFRDWVPFLLLLMGYELMRGVADNMAHLGASTAADHGNIQLGWLIDVDRVLGFGHIPSIWLQDRLYTPGVTHWYDVAAAVVYLMHFFLPLIFGFALWWRSKDHFRRFAAALLLLSYGAFVFFLLLPTAPPWLAQEWGYLDQLQRPSQGAFRAFLPERYHNFDTFKLWTGASPNPVAAFPSLHAAFPFLVMLFALRFWGRKGWLLLPYNAAVWFAIVYLSQHWLIDAIAGAVWALACFGAVEWLWAWQAQRAGVARESSLVRDG